MLQVQHIHTLAHMQTVPGQLFSLLFNMVILCLVMGTGSWVPRVPLDNWLLPHLLTSPPLTFLHFTFKVLFLSPLTSSSSSSSLRPLSHYSWACIFFFFILPIFTLSFWIILCKIESQFPTVSVSEAHCDWCDGFFYYCAEMNGIKFSSYAIMIQFEFSFWEYFSTYVMFLRISLSFFPPQGIKASFLFFHMLFCFVLDIVFCMLQSLCPWPWLLHKMMIYILSDWNDSEWHRLKISHTDAAPDPLYPLYNAPNLHFEDANKDISIPTSPCVRSLHLWTHSSLSCLWT